MSTHDHPRNDLALAEAALFLAPQPLTRRALAKILGGVAQAYVDQLLEDLKEQFEDDHRGIELHIEDGRAMFRVKNAYVSEVAHLAPQHDIPRQELRTLAVIAYNHPMTQSNLIKVRGNKGYKHVQELLERGLITSEPHGRTLLLRVTQDFLRHFGLRSVEEFRFQFPSAAEENAEALARAAQPAHQDGLAQDDEMGTESLDATPEGTDLPVEQSDRSEAEQEAIHNEDSALVGEQAADAPAQVFREEIIASDIPAESPSAAEVESTVERHEPEDEPVMEQRKEEDDDG